MRKRSVGRCPKCGSTDTIRIVYGMPTEEAFAAAEKGELSIGGCCQEIDAPDAQCKGCGHTWLKGGSN
jgi:hypothetical protein